MLTLDTRVTLNDGHAIPQLGFGVFQLKDPDSCRQAVLHALDVGYRHVDTAKVYGNEEAVGEALRDSGLPRDEVFVTTKLWIRDFAYDAAIAACEQSLLRLGLDWVDLYLIHWPTETPELEEAWSAMAELKRQGKIRSMGVSNFSVERFQRHPAFVQVPPAINQVELTPFLSQRPLAAFCRKHGIAVECWSPLAQGTRFDHPELVRLVAETGRTAAQILLRWHLQHGYVVIPKATGRAHIEENAALFDFALDDGAMARLDGLNEDASVIAWRPEPDWY